MENTQILGIVDRIEGDKAVLEMLEPEDWRLIIPSYWLPEQREGMVVEFHLCDRPDVERERRRKLNKLQDELLERPKD